MFFCRGICDICAMQLETCPICRVEIKKRIKITVEADTNSVGGESSKEKPTTSLSEHVSRENPQNLESEVTEIQSSSHTERENPEQGKPVNVNPEKSTTSNVEHLTQDNPTKGKSEIVTETPTSCKQENVSDTSANCKSENVTETSSDYSKSEHVPQGNTADSKCEYTKQETDALGARDLKQTLSKQSADLEET